MCFLCSGTTPKTRATCKFDACCVYNTRVSKPSLLYIEIKLCRFLPKPIFLYHGLPSHSLHQHFIHISICISTLPTGHWIKVELGHGEKHFRSRTIIMQPFQFQVRTRQLRQVRNDKPRRLIALLLIPLCNSVSVAFTWSGGFPPFDSSICIFSSSKVAARSMNILAKNDLSASSSPDILHSIKAMLLSHSKLVSSDDLLWCLSHLFPFWNSCASSGNFHGVSIFRSRASQYMLQNLAMLSLSIYGEGEGLNYAHPFLWGQKGKREV